MIWNWEFCPGRRMPPSSGYITASGQARGACSVCGYDNALISGGRVRHHFRELLPAAVGSPEDQPGGAA